MKNIKNRCCMKILRFSIYFFFLHKISGWFCLLTLCTWKYKISQTLHKGMLHVILPIRSHMTMWQGNKKVKYLHFSVLFYSQVFACCSYTWRKEIFNKYLKLEMLFFINWNLHMFCYRYVQWDCLEMFLLN